MSHQQPHKKDWRNTFEFESKSLLVNLAYFKNGVLEVLENGSKNNSLRIFGLGEIKSFLEYIHKGFKIVFLF